MLARQLQQESFQIENLAGVCVKKVGFRRFSLIVVKNIVILINVAFNRYFAGQVRKAGTFLWSGPISGTC